MAAIVTKVGIIGGSGLYEIDGLEDVSSSDVMTPFGRPSDPIVTGRFAGKEVCFLPRHGKGHRLLPSEVNSRANIWALRSLGVTHIVSVSAVGSLRLDYRPADVVVPSSILDRTMGVRPNTFFGNGLVGHVGFADPFCKEFRKILISSSQAVLGPAPSSSQVHDGGTYVCIEGPRFSSRAESHYFRKSGADIIGMTAMPEAALAREAEMAYGTLAFVTDYDCWNEETEAVSVAAVLAVLKKNTEVARAIVAKVIAALPQASENPVFEAARFALMTAKDLVPSETIWALEPLYGKYWKSDSVTSKT
jgi:5'-methylthioadenosine phosphorylase